MKLSYAAADLPALARVLVRLVESLTGGRRLAKAARRFKVSEPDDIQEATSSFYRRAAEAFELRIAPHRNSTGSVPATGGLLLVANHPFGVIDGLAIANIVERVRADLRIVVWDAITIPQRYRQHFIPLDLNEHNRDARRQNARARREMIDHLQSGGSLLLFPAGAAALAERAFSRPQESTWTPMMARIARASNARVLPIYVGGANSRSFHVVTRLSGLLRRAWFIRETVARMGASIQPVVASPIVWNSYASEVGGDIEATALLRKSVLALEPDRESDTRALPVDDTVIDRRTVASRY